MPLFDPAATMPQPGAYDFDPNAWGQNPFGAAPTLPPPTPGMAPPMPPQPPALPDPTMAAQPPDPTRTANPTGGPASGATSPIRAGVFTQLYKLGQQMPGKQNMFSAYGPQEAPPADPFALLAPPPVEPAPEMLRAQPAPQMGPQPGMGPRGGMPKPPTQAERLAADRFPRLARFLGRPVVPPPDVNQKPR